MSPLDMTFAVATPLLGSTAVIRQHGRGGTDVVPAFDADVEVPGPDGGADGAPPLDEDVEVPEPDGEAGGVPPLDEDVEVPEPDGGADGVPPFDPDVEVPEPDDPTVTFNVVGCAELYARPWGVSPTAVTVRL
jgi:hypothetical protein